MVKLNENVSKNTKDIEKRGLNSLFSHIQNINYPLNLNNTKTKMVKFIPHKSSRSIIESAMIL